MDESTKRITEQACKYSEAVGKGIPSHIIAEIAEFAKDAMPTKFFAEHREVPFWYEKLDKEGLVKRAGSIADLWVEVSWRRDFVEYFLFIYRTRMIATSSGPPPRLRGL